MIAYVNDYACFFCKSHLQNERFISDRQAVDRFGSKVFLFWFLVIVNSFVYVTHPLANFARRDWYGDLGLMKWLSQTLRVELRTECNDYI